MSNSQRNCKDCIYQKPNSPNKLIRFFRPEKPKDLSYILWHNLNLKLNYSWRAIYDEYGWQFQDSLNDKTENNNTTHGDYFNQCVEILRKNCVHGLLPVEDKNFLETENYVKFSTTSTIHPINLLECIRYTPVKLQNQSELIVFIIYQILNTLKQLHHNSIPHGDLYLQNVYINDQWNVRLSLPVEFQRILINHDRNNDNEEDSNCKLNSYNPIILIGDNVNTYSDLTPAYDSSLACHKNSLADNTELWVTGKLSNLEYLLYLNRIAGRVYTNPNNHPMLPWVTDFTKEFGGIRDLTLSKFRINKGDEQVDKMFMDQNEELERYTLLNPLEKQQYLQRLSNFNILTNPTYFKPSHYDSPGANIKINRSRRPLSNHVHYFFDDINTIGYIDDPVLPPPPHHVSDVLSELSYYAYMARVTPIETLQKSYRPKYKPSEYKWSMAKMYAWTPDECIPQFYLEPSILKSRHDDMPDIELPEWCGNDPVKCIEYHRAVLESDEVSAQLHHWIDLVFGYKLLGNDAVLAKNVHRQFTERDPNFLDHGLSILFRKPHPSRMCNQPDIKKYFSATNPIVIGETVPENKSQYFSSAVKSLPEDYDPYALMEYYKNYQAFTTDICSNSTLPLKCAKSTPRSEIEVAMENDIIAVCCFMVELFCHENLKSDYHNCSSAPIQLSQRIQNCLSLMKRFPNSIPMSFSNPIERLLYQFLSSSPVGPTDNPIPSIYQLLGSPDWFIFSPKYNNIYELTILHNYYSHPCTPYNYLNNIQRFLNIQYKRCDLFLTPSWLDLMGLNLEKILKVLYDEWKEVVDKYSQIKTEENLEEVNKSEEDDGENIFKNIIEILLVILRRYALLAGKLPTLKFIIPHIIQLYPIKSLLRLSNSNSAIHSYQISLYQKPFLKLLLLRIGLANFLNLPIIQYLVYGIVIGQNNFYCSTHNEVNKKHSFQSNMPESKKSQTVSERSIWYTQFEEEDYLNEAPRNHENDTISVDSLPDYEDILPNDETNRNTTIHPNLNHYKSSPALDTMIGASTGNHYPASNPATSDNVDLAQVCGGSASPMRRVVGTVPVTSGKYRNATSPPSVSLQKKLVGRKKSSITESISTTYNSKVTPRSVLSLDCSKMSIAYMSSSSILWLAEVIGPLMSTRYILMEMLSQIRALYRDHDNIDSFTANECTKSIPIKEAWLSDLVTGTYESITIADVYCGVLFDTIRSLCSLYGYMLISEQIRPFLDSIFKSAYENSLVVETNSLTNTDNTEESEDQIYRHVSVCSELICALSLLKFLLYLLPREQLESFIADRISEKYLPFVIEMIGSYSRSIPAQYRRIMLHKTIDIIYLISTRLVDDLHNSSVISVFILLFGLFNKVYSLSPDRSNPVDTSVAAVMYRDAATLSESGETKSLSNAFSPRLRRIESNPTSKYYVNIINESGNSDSGSNDNGTRSTDSKYNEQQNDNATGDNHAASVKISLLQKGLSQLKKVITIQLAYVLYVTFSRLLGQHRFGNLINNHTLICSLMEQHEQFGSLDANTNSTTSSPIAESKEQDAPYTLADQFRQQQLEDYIKIQVSSTNTDYHRHLSGDWGLYWKDQLGSSAINKAETPFSFKHMQLATFTGHTTPIRGISLLSTENAFFSYSSNGNIRLYSLSDMNLSKSPCSIASRFQYQHTKFVNDAVYIEGLKMGASVDGMVHLWDPSVGKKILDTSLGVSAPAWSLLAPVPPSLSLVTVANKEGRTITMDTRTGYPCFSFNVNIKTDFATILASAGEDICQAACSPDGNYLLLGNTKGYIACVDVRNCRLLGNWRSHEGAITQIKFLDNDWCVTSSNDQTGLLTMTPFGRFPGITNQAFNTSSRTGVSNKNSPLFYTDASSHFVPNYRTNQQQISMAATTSTGDQNIGPIHSLMLLPGSILAGGGENKFCLYSGTTYSNGASSNQSNSFLQLFPKLYKDTVTSSAFMLHNQLFLFGNKNGNISLWY